MVEFQSSGRALLPETAGQVPPGCTAGTETHTLMHCYMCVPVWCIYTVACIVVFSGWLHNSLLDPSTPQLLDYFAVDEDATIANLQQYAVNQVMTLCVSRTYVYVSYVSLDPWECMRAVYWCCCVDLDSFAEAETSMPAPPCCPRRHRFHEEDVSTVPWGRGEGILKKHRASGNCMYVCVRYIGTVSLAHLWGSVCV